MTLRLQTRVDEPRTAGDWPLPGRPPFMSSSTHARLVLDLRRYVDGEIAGRSYLIAGHRGAGKTKLTLRAIEDLVYDRLQKVLQADDGLVMSRSNLQRPLLVKLHGPSLLDPLPSKSSQKESKSRGRKAKDESQGEAEARGSEGDQSAQPVAKAALSQIAIALYRALARDISEGYRFKARRLRRRGGQGQELAAQLVLDLDSGPSPAVLRSYWAQIGRLEGGVLWPTGADGRLAELGVTDQGLREILALATAGQAFRVCAGDLRKEEKSRDDASDETSASLAGKSDLKDIAGRLGALGLGALTGATLWSSGAPLALLAALLVWILGGATVSWSATQSRKRARTTDYSFLPDTSVQSLDRDLPVVIERIRAAGLAPVFVIDELDKVPNAPARVAEIIGRLKHIIADFGFFCFLTDRSYFDYVDAKVQSSAFPTEHTYFSERRLVVYQPDELHAYLTGLFEGGSAPFPTTDELARTLFALYVAHRSKLNFADVMRELGRLTRDDGTLLLSADELNQRQDVRLASTVQLAIEVVLNRSYISPRVQHDPGFAQLAYDTLYSISRCWETDSATYDAGPGALKAYLEGRVNSAAAQGDQVWSVPPADLSRLEEALRDLLALLTDFSQLEIQLASVPRLMSSGAAALLAIVPGETGLLTPIADNLYRFNVDPFGRPLGGGQGPLDQAAVKEQRDLLNECLLLLRRWEVSVDGLVRAQLLPPTVSEAALSIARDELGRWLQGMRRDEDVRPALALADQLQTTLDRHGARISAGLLLARTLAMVTGRNLGAAIEALARYPVLRATAGEDAWDAELWGAAHPTFPLLRTTDPLRGAAASLKPFENALNNVSVGTATEQGLQPLLDISRAAWPARLLEYFAGRPPPLEAFTYHDLLAATVGAHPANVFQADFSQMRPRDWAIIALQALPRASEAGGPRWLLVAALRALQFEAGLLTRMVTASPVNSLTGREEADLAAQMAAGAPAGRKGLLVIAERDLDAGAAAPSDGMLYVRPSEFEQHRVGLEWLQDLDGFEGVADELDPE